MTPLKKAIDMAVRGDSLLVQVKLMNTSFAFAL